MKLIIGTSLMCCALSAAALTQDNDTLEEIVVTATQRPQVQTDIPASVDRLDYRSLASTTALTGAEDIVERLTGVQAAVANGTQVAFQIRGIGAVDHQALTPGAAAIYADGVFMATNVQTGGLLFDLESIEVLKGPQSTLYGRNASSGAINFRSVRPDADQRSHLSASFGSFDRLDIEGAYGAALSDTVHIRLAARALRQNPVLTNTEAQGSSDPRVRNAGGRTERYGAKASLLWQGTNGDDLLLRASYELDTGINPSPRNATLDVERFELSIGGDGVQDTDNEFYTLSAEWTGAIDDWHYFSLTAFTGYAQNYGFDFDGTPAPFGNETLNANLSYNRDYHQISEEVRLQKGFSWGHLLLGASASYDDFSQVYTIWCGELNEENLLGSCRYVGAPGRTGPNPASPGTATTLITDIDQTRVALAAFTRNEINVTDKLALIVGLRLTHEHINGEGNGRHIFDDGTIAFNNRDGAGPAIGENTINDWRINGNAALNYSTGFGAIYASISTGYKSGGFNGEVANNALHYADEGLFGAETVTAYEIGLKGEFGPSLRVNLASFLQDYASPQARIFVNFALPDGSQIVSNSLSNLDNAISYGIEADATWRPLAGLFLDAGLTILSTRIDQTSDLGGNAALFDGNPLPFASHLSAVFSPRYQVDLNDKVRASFNIAAKYRSGFYLDAEGLEDRRQQGYTTLSAEASLYFKDKGITLSVFGRNLLNEDFALSGFGFIGYNTFRSAPRLLGAQISVDF